jgi:hypothetical protein
MAVTVSLYNHTAALFASGANPTTDTYKVQLLTAATFNATHTTLAAVGGTEVAAGNGYSTGGATLTGVTVTTVTTNDAMFDANDVVWSATGGSLAASYAVLYNATDSGSPPLVFIDFGGTESAGAGTDFKMVWNTAGIFSFTVA